MSIVVKDTAANFSKIAARASWNTFRTGLIYEAILGGNAALSAKNLVAGGADGDMLGNSQSFAPRYMTTVGQFNRLQTQVNRPTDFTFIIVASACPAGNVFNINNRGETNPVGLLQSATQMQLQYNGAGGPTISSTSPALTAGAPYFWAARVTTGSPKDALKLWRGKANALATATSTAAGPWTAPTPRQPISIGGDQPGTTTVTHDDYYAAVYNTAVIDGNVASIYALARAFYLGLNADF